MRTTPWLLVLGLAAVAPAQVDSPLEADPQWQVATRGHQLEFPRDHGSHPGYRIEWWYYTGNLVTDTGRRFGYQLTFFRNGIDANPENPSRWALRDLHLAHFAIADLESEQLSYGERIARTGAGWAGAEVGRLHVWNRDWSAQMDGDVHRLTATFAGEAIEFELRPEKPLVLHGDQGLSQKGTTAGNASYYSSFTRLATTGTLRCGQVEHSVTGTSWMDHEVGSSFLEDGQVGWDWISLHLDDGRDLMLYQLRRDDGTLDPHSSGTLINADGTSRALASGEFTLTEEPAMPTWTSEQSGGTYPVVWRAQVPDAGLDLRISAGIPDCELATPLSTGVTYWEGPVVATDAKTAKQLGRGYLEMTGYAGVSLGRALGK